MKAQLISIPQLLIILIISINTSYAIDDAEKALSLRFQIDTQKKELIELGRDIKVLEEVLLYPSKSRVSVYFTMDVAVLFSLEKVKLLLNDEVVAEHIYSSREVEGFGKGSSQRLFIGNVEPGKYKLTAIFMGKGPRGRPYKRGVKGIFLKENSQKILEISIEDDVRKQQPAFYIRDVS